jgi:molybdopterin molybdotransferase
MRDKQMQKQAVPEFEEARRIILELVEALSTERVKLLESNGRILAEDGVAPWNLPRFSNSAMDGYAVRAEDCGAVLQVIDYVAAGGRPARAVTAGTAIKIMTGAPVPDGCDSVVPFEEIEEAEETVRATAVVKPGQHIRIAGEDVREGEVVLTSGRLVRPFEINMMASFGKEYVTVVRRARVAIVATGDELVELGETPGFGQIVDSNAYSLAAAVSALGAIPMIVGIARDNLASHREMLQEGLKADVLITSAGVSVGDRDFVREVLEEMGVKTVFWRVKVKPGKAMAFGIKDGRPVFALPGNPVSSMLTFEEFAAPALLKMMGHSITVKPLFPAVLQSGLKKKKGQTALVRVKLECTNGRYLAWSAGRQDTGFVRTMMDANAVAVLPAERDEFLAGEEVQVHLLGGAAGGTSL